MDALASERRFGEVIPCKQCGRSTAAARPACLYCGCTITADNPAPKLPALSRAEAWELGFNVVVSSSASTGGDVGRAAKIMDADPAQLAGLLASASPVPLFRASENSAAKSLTSQLAELGFVCNIVADIDLDLKAVNSRLRKLTITDEYLSLVDFNTGEETVFGLSDARFLVTGTVRETRTDRFQKRAKFGETSSSADADIFGDGSVLDLYFSGMEKGFRITPAGFDFSCLGSEKALMARDNWSKLIDMLCSKLPELAIDDEYDRLARALEHVWPIARRSEAKGLVKTGFGKREFGRTDRSSNAEQFLRYSRLRWHLYEK